jgi:PIN domain nuclease of toxin-antitoxin system
MPVRMRENAVTALPIDQRHCFRAISLPPHHRDPFDRLLIAQAQIEELAVATSDGDFAAYGIDVIPL